MVACACLAVVCVYVSRCAHALNVDVSLCVCASLWVIVGGSLFADDRRRVHQTHASSPCTSAAWHCGLDGSFQASPDRLQSRVDRASNLTNWEDANLGRR